MHLGSARSDPEAGRDARSFEVTNYIVRVLIADINQPSRFVVGDHCGIEHKAQRFEPLEYRGRALEGLWLLLFHSLGHSVIAPNLPVPFDRLTVC